MLATLFDFRAAPPAARCSPGTWLAGRARGSVQGRRGVLDAHLVRPLWNGRRGGGRSGTTLSSAGERSGDRRRQQPENYVGQRHFDRGRLDTTRHSITGGNLAASFSTRASTPSCGAGGDCWSAGAGDHPLAACVAYLAPHGAGRRRGRRQDHHPKKGAGRHVVHVLEPRDETVIERASGVHHRPRRRREHAAFGFGIIAALASAWPRCELRGLGRRCCRAFR